MEEFGRKMDCPSLTFFSFPPISYLLAYPNILSALHVFFDYCVFHLVKQGFRKVDPEQWEFANDDFVRGKPHLLKNIHRRKPVHSHSLTNLHGQVNSNPLTDSERQKYRDGIERLRKEREVLLLESQRQRKENDELESHVQLLRDRLQQLETRQYSFASCFARVIHKPELATMPQLENHDRKRRNSSRLDNFHDDSSYDDSLSTQRTSRRGSPENLSLDLDIDLLDRMESSLSFWENMVEDIDTLCDPRNPSLEFSESTTCAETPTISYTQLDVDNRSCGSPRIDMNSEPLVVCEPGPRKERENVAQGVNDVFWEQFLTENPGSSNAQEVQSERKDIRMREKDSRLIENGRYWLGFRNGGTLSEHIGQLTPAGSS